MNSFPNAFFTCSRTHILYMCYFSPTAAGKVYHHHNVSSLQSLQHTLALLSSRPCFQGGIEVILALPFSTFLPHGCRTGVR